MNELEVGLLGFGVIVLAAVGQYCRSWLMVKAAENDLRQQQIQADTAEIRANMRKWMNGKSVHHDGEEEGTTQPTNEPPPDEPPDATPSAAPSIAPYGASPDN